MYTAACGTVCYVNICMSWYISAYSTREMYVMVHMVPGNTCKYSSVCLISLCRAILTFRKRYFMVRKLFYKHSLLPDFVLYGVVF